MTAEDLTVHCLIRNEAYWSWFALGASLPHCGRLMVWDTGSTDATPDILSALGCGRFELRRVPPVGEEGLAPLRNAMIAETRTEWFAVVDGDEVWPPALWAEVATWIADPAADVVVVPFRYPLPRLGYFGVGDDDFEIAGVRGAYASRVFRRSRGVRLVGRWGEEQFLDAGARVLSRGSLPCMRVTRMSAWHFTLLERSPHDACTLGRGGKLHFDDAAEVAWQPMDPSEAYPEVLLGPRPAAVPNPFLAQCRALRDAAPLPHPNLARR